MPGPGTELCGVKQHCGVVRGRRLAAGHPGLALGAFSGPPCARLGMLHLGCQNGSPARFGRAGAGLNVHLAALNSAPSGFGVPKGREVTKYKLSAVLGRPLCGPPWPVRMLKSDEGFGKFPLHLTPQTHYLTLLC